MKKFVLSYKTKTFTLSILLMMAVFASAVTLAYYTDTTNAITNTFTVAEIKTHIDETTGQGSNGIWQKSPKIYNEGPSKGFIRARITVSPDLWSGGVESNRIQLKFGTWNGGAFSETSSLQMDANEHNGWLYDGDGYFYYKSAVEKDHTTNSLFDAVIIGTEVSENFDITIYQEAVATTSTKSVESLTDLKAAFTAVN